MTVFNIKIVSDTVCPWYVISGTLHIKLELIPIRCYVGKKKLERGIAAYQKAHPSSQDTFRTEWLPYYLNPDAPKSGIDKQQMYASKFGEERTKLMQERLTGIGQDVGINFKYGGKTGNTRDSHRLVQFAKTKGSETQTKTIEALFESYFEKEEDITSHQVLQAAGVKAGLEAGEVKQCLETDQEGAKVDAEVKEARSSIISGVPNFTINEQFEVRGAQDAEGFKRIFEKIKEMEG